MLNIKNIALICAILFSTTIQGISVEDDNSKNEAGSILQLRNRSLNSQLPHTPGHELDAFWQNILVTVLKTKEEFLTFSLTCKQFYKVIHNISKFHRLLFLGRINAEAIAPDMQDNPTFQPNLFSLYFNLLKEDGSPNFTAIDCFETQKGPLLKIWLLHRFSGVFDGAYHEMEQEIDRHSDALSYRMAPSGIWSFDQTVNKLIPPNIANLLSCERLILRVKDLVEVPPQIGQLESVIRLDLYDNKLQTLPLELKKLTKLENLTLAANQFKTFPEVILTMFNLKELTFGFHGETSNTLEELPAGISSLSNLEELSLPGNNLKSLPTQIGQLTTLKSLRIDANRLETVCPEIFNLTNLKSLNLKSNRISKLPNNIGNLKGITFLYLGENELTELPEEFWQMSALTTLKLDGNQLTSLSSRVFALQKLEWLEVKSNKVTSFPDGFHTMPRLLLLNVSYNPVVDRDALFSDLKKFKDREPNCSLNLSMEGGPQYIFTCDEDEI